VLRSGVIALTRRAFGAYSCGRPGRIGSGLPKERCSWSIDSFPALDGDFIASTSPLSRRTYLGSSLEPAVMPVLCDGWISPLYTMFMIDFLRGVY